MVVYKILCGFQTTGKFEIGTYPESLSLGKVDKKYLILKAKEVAYMYKALECGCIYKCIGIEHSEKSDEAVAIELFIELLNFKARSQFIIYCLHPGSSNPRAEPDHIRNLRESYTKGIELFSKPVPDGGHDLEVYNHESKEISEDFLKAHDLMNKNIPPRLLDFVAKIELAPTSPTVYLRRLLDSSIPEVVEKAQKWADVALSGEDLKITQTAIRRRYDEPRRSKKRK